MQFRFSIGAVLLISAASVCAQADPEELRTIVNELNEVESWLSESDSELSRLNEEIRTADSAIAESVTSSQSTEQDILEISARIDQLVAESEELLLQKEAGRKKANWYTQGAYRLSRVDPLKMFLNNENIDQHSRMMYYHQVLTKASTDEVNAYSDLLSTVEQKRSELDDQRNKMESRVQELADTTALLRSQQDERRVTVREWNDAIESKQQLRQKLMADRRRLSRIVSESIRLQPESGEDNTTVQILGQRNWPVNGTLTNEFGDPRAGGRLRWEGVLISAPAGTDIVAVAPGRVIFASWVQGYGLLSIIEHGGGMVTLYGHCDSLTKSAGDPVEGGEVIGTVGQSGGRTGDALYFEVRSHGTPIDPKRWLADE